MPFFPQLSTGAVAQFPAFRTRFTRTVLGESDGGIQAKLADPGFERAEWVLRLPDLAEAEASALEALFEAVEGRLRPFVFLDPLANLLAWSEVFGNSPWQKPAPLQLTAGIADPFGTARASRVINTSAIPMALAQEIEGPGSYRYAFSVWARGAGSSLTLRRSAGPVAMSEEFVAGSGWRRVALRCGAAAIAEPPVRFEIELAPGAAVDLFAAQVEPQVQPGPYKRTGAESGVYMTANFAQDEIAVDAEGPNRFSAVIRIAINKEV